MTTLDYTIAVIDDQPNVFVAEQQYAALCVGFGSRFCPNEAADGAAYCLACQARADDFHARIELVPVIGQLAAHVRQACAGSPCRSCGDMTVCGDFCVACTEAAEPRRLSVKARAVAALALVVLILTMACSDLPNNGSCTSPSPCYSNQGSNP